MPASRGPRMRASPGGDPSIISDLYIDDAGVVAIAAPTVKSPGAQRTLAATSALRDAGVDVHDEKGHDDALDEKVWGCAFYRHIVGSERDRMTEIVALSWALAFAPAVVPEALASLIGYWSHALLFRRAGYAVLQESYAVARDPSRVPIALPLSVRDELIALACLAPLLYTDLRAPVSATVVATDATLTRGAAVSAVVPLLTARRLFAGPEFRGADARLVDRVDLPDEAAALAADPVLAATIAAWPWLLQLGRGRFEQRTIWTPITSTRRSCGHWSGSSLDAADRRPTSSSGSLLFWTTSRPAGAPQKVARVRAA